MGMERLRVVVAGGGVAGLETLLALRALAGDAVRLHLLSPGDHFVYRPLEVLEPFDSCAMVRIPWARVLHDLRVSHTSSALKSIDLDGHRALTTTAQALPFDVLVLTPGGTVRPAIAGAVTVGGTGATGLMRQILDQLRAGNLKRIAFAVPPGVTWTLPLYELALLTARLARNVTRPVELLVATAESQPLELFGAEAAGMVRELLGSSSVRLRTNGLVERRVDGRTWLELPPDCPADAIVAMPRLAGPYLEDLRSDENGFLLVDSHGAVNGETDVYAAGDATSFPVKQGGLAAQQADAAASHIARRAGAEVELAPFDPILRAMLLTGDAPRYLRIALTAAASEPEISDESPWWPPVKIVGRHLAPYLASHTDWGSS